MYIKIIFKFVNFERSYNVLFNISYVCLPPKKASAKGSIGEMYYGKHLRFKNRQSACITSDSCHSV